MYIYRSYRDYKESSHEHKRLKSTISTYLGKKKCPAIIGENLFASFGVQSFFFEHCALPERNQVVGCIKSVGGLFFELA